MTGLERRGPGVARASAQLAERLRTGLAELALHELLDFGPRPPRGPRAVERLRRRRGGGVGHARGVAPTVDLAVLALEPGGALRAAANVVLAPDHPDGAIVDLDADLAARGVRWRRWRPGPIEITPGGGWGTRRSARDEIVPVTGDPALDIVSPYPASLFKLLVAWQILRLVDRGALALDEPYAFQPRGPGRQRPGVRTIADWLDDMVTWSDNRATCALLKLLHDRDAIFAMSEELAALGLGTLQVHGTRPSNGGRWLEGRIVMTALDTARLLWLVEGGDGEKATLWRRPDGAGDRAVTPAELSAHSRALLRALLGQQGFNTILSTANWGARRRLGGDYPAQGIPHAVHDRWIDPDDGSVVVQQTRWREDVRASSARAEVRFAHKTGSTWGFSSDAGIVTSLPGHAPRRYVIAFLSDLGHRDADPRFAGARRPPCADPAIGVCFSERIAQIGALADRAVLDLGAVPR